MKNISQKRFLRGLNSAFGIFAQPDGTIPRISNLLLNKRGALKTCDGCYTLALSSRAYDLTIGKAEMFAELFLFMPAGSSRSYFGIIKDPYKHLGVPVLSSVVNGGAGGTLPAATYFYVITANDGSGGETIASNELSFVNAGAIKNQLTWVALTNAISYNIYRGTAAGAEVLIASKVTGLTYLDDGSAVPGTLTPSVTDTTQLSLFVKIPTSGVGAPTFDPDANLIFTFPADMLPNPDGTGGGEGGGGGGGGDQGTGGSASTISGGVIGNISALPMILQFVNSMILCLGNGITPYKSDGTTPNTVQITNTFSAIYPIWQTAVTYATGDLIQVNVAGTLYAFKAIQGGTSGGVAPAFTAVAYSTVTDNKIIWQNIGPVSTSPAPRGAAHGIVYAGSLWVANTSIVASSDGLDGPSAVAMSDLNNFNSWNPLNRAQIQKDDGGQINGLCTFTIAEQGIAPTGSLLVFKDFATFQILSVFGSVNFAIQQLKTDMGAIASRSILFVPGFGVIRLTHMGFAVTDGVRDKLISEELRPYLFGDPAEPDIIPVDWNFAYYSKAAQCADPPMYMCAVPIIGGDPIPATIAGCTLLLVGVAAGPIGIYYAQVSLVGPMWESQVSPELGPLQNDGPNLSFRVNVPGAPPAGALNYRAYIYQKNSAGNRVKGYYIDIPRNQTAANFGDLSTAKTGYPPSGKTAALTRVFCYDLVLKAWAIIDLPFSISVLRQFRAPGSTPITMTGGYDDGTMKRIQAGDPDWDGILVNWSVRSREVYGEGGTQSLFIRSALVHGIANTPVITITTNVDGTDLPAESARVTQMGGNNFEARLDIIQLARMAHVALSGSGQIEIDAIDFQTEVGKVAAPIVIA